MTTDGDFIGRLVRDLHTGEVRALVVAPDGEITDVSTPLTDAEAARVNAGDIGGLSWDEEHVSNGWAWRRAWETIAEHLLA